MSPHSILRVRGGQPISGGPSLETEDSPGVPESSYTANVQERILHAGQPPFPGDAKLVFRPPPLNFTVSQNDPDENEPDLVVAEPKNVAVPPFFDPDDYQVCANGVTKSYIMGKVVVPVLKGVNLGIRKGEFLAIVGQSGSGKSTLLHLLGTLDTPDQGTIHFDGERIDNIASGQRDILRNRFIGMIFQFYHLLPELSVLENVLSPLMIRDSTWRYFCNRPKHYKKGRELLDAVGLSHRLTHKPNELSGGEMQRAAIARALISEPQILLADEPTGNLDAKSAREILQLIRELNQKRNLTIVMVTHDLSIAQKADRMVTIYDGQVTHSKCKRNGVETEKSVEI
ncbi:MAG: ABC transporter ATP-binding protein [Planctomycetaceae bacterium]|nr:ABC transporter ATP-binding protein [Planctomycetaceae bacterium]